jgi:hypothetical protein
LLFDGVGGLWTSASLSLLKKDFFKKLDIDKPAKMLDLSMPFWLNCALVNRPSPAEVLCCEANGKLG